MKTILCFGDSNTWGCNPLGGRFDHKTRWPMAMKILLNEGCPTNDPDFWIIEEGQNGRTTCREDFVDGDRNGFRHIIPVLESHQPLDMVVVMLGTNDLKPRFSPVPLDIALGVKKIVIAIQNSRTGHNNIAPKVLVICPPPTVDAPAFKDMFGDASIELSKQLPPFYRRITEECGVLFLNAGEVIQSSKTDGIHFDAEEHLKLAKAVAEIVREKA